jgi:D-alanyl-D-alanine carboxypeptidase/D-alanyl-D-alanine-endopeptidase (penicillin-binding protein 4)
MRRAILLAAMLLAMPALAARELPAPVREALAAAGVPLGAVAAVVEPVGDGAPAVSHNAGASMNPASVMKIVTTYAALDLLGPAFTFRTEAYTSGELSGGVLNGNLHIRGGGDPKLTYDRVWRMARQMRGRGLREIRGDIVLDRSYFAPAAHDPARFDNDPRRAYNAGADALLVNFNAINFRFIPEGNAVRVVAEPDLPNVEIASRLRVSAEPCVNFRRDLAHDAVEIGLLATVTFSGTYPAACGERALPLAIFDGARFTESTLRWLWTEAGGVLRGNVRAGPVPPEAQLLLRQESEPLANLVRDMNKFSSNVMARHLFLALSAEPGGFGGEPAASARIVSAWLRGRRIEAPELAIENGSGLSRNERVSAATLAAVLRQAWSHAVMPEMMSSLPVLALDGTLRSRRARGAAGQAHLKGGTLTDVQSVAGYVLDHEGRRWVVAMMINHARAGAAQGALDALVEWTYESAGRRSRGAR